MEKTVMELRYSEYTLIATSELWIARGRQMVTMFMLWSKISMVLTIGGVGATVVETLASVGIGTYRSFAPNL